MTHYRKTIRLCALLFLLTGACVSAPSDEVAADSPDDGSTPKKTPRSAVEDCSASRISVEVPPAPRFQSRSLEPATALSMQPWIVTTPC